MNVSTIMLLAHNSGKEFFFSTICGGSTAHYCPHQIARPEAAVSIVTSELSRFF